MAVTTRHSRLLPAVPRARDLRHYVIKARPIILPPRERPVMAPFYDGGCQGPVRDAFEGAATLVGVNVVRPVGRSTLTPLARRRGVAAVPGSVGGNNGTQLEKLRSGARALADQVRRAEPGHHDHYSPELRAALLYSGGLSPADTVSLVRASPWGLPGEAPRADELRERGFDSPGAAQQLLTLAPVWPPRLAPRQTGEFGEKGSVLVAVGGLISRLANLPRSPIFLKSVTRSR